MTDAEAGFAQSLMLAVARDIAEGTALLHQLAQAVVALGAMAKPETEAEAQTVDALVSLARRVVATRPTMN